MCSLSCAELPYPPRVNVVGTSGSGKTTYARMLAAHLSVPHFELDALHWLPDWQERPREEFRDLVSCTLTPDAWVIDGNYSKVRDVVWLRANTVIWLDYPISVIMRRLIVRTFRRSVMRQELWNGNRESLRTALFSRDSILLWALQSYRRRRREYPELFAQAAYLHVIHLTSPRVADHWLAELPVPTQQDYARHCPSK